MVLSFLKPSKSNSLLTYSVLCFWLFKRISQDWRISGFNIGGMNANNSSFLKRKCSVCSSTHHKLLWHQTPLQACFSFNPTCSYKLHFWQVCSLHLLAATREVVRHKTPLIAAAVLLVRPVDWEVLLPVCKLCNTHLYRRLWFCWNLSTQKEISRQCSVPTLSFKYILITEECC